MATMEESNVNFNRYQCMQQKFVEIFSENPYYFVRAPGRVNLIGEHIDYCGYAVLPMAIEQDVVIAVSTNDENMLRVYNTDSKFQNYCCTSVGKTLSAIPEHLLWHHYVLCGFKAVVDYLKIPEPVGMNALVCGRVPQNAGVSSSSALVCSVALATVHANDKDLPKEELCELTAVCETYLGLDDGGMDQAIAFLAEPGIAKLIAFDPIRGTDVKLPKDAVFVIANSCVEINKAATSQFNTRVAECRLASQVIAKKLKLNWKEIRTLKDLQERLKKPLHEMSDFVKENLHKIPYTKEEICQLLEVTCDELNQCSLADNVHHDASEFKLCDRAVHVYQEAWRVLRFKSLCDQMGQTVLQDLGDLMYESHASCRDLYECSCSELEELVILARASGAFGSRVTGAGWGGCTVSLVSAENVPEFLQKMKSQFFDKHLTRPYNLSDVLFATSPGNGAQVIPYTCPS